MEIIKKIFNLFPLRSRKNKRKIERLEKELNDLKITKIEDYIGERLLIDTSDGFEIKFLGETVVRILAKLFWILVKDSENYLVFSFKDYEQDESVEVILVKEGHLTPLEKLKELEEENEMLKKKLSKLSN